MCSKYIIDRWSIDPKWSFVIEKLIKLIQLEIKVQNNSIYTEVHNGKMDFRGVNLSEKKIKKFDIVDVDFSCSKFRNTWIEHSRFEKCIFDKTDFTDFSDHENYFNDCSFTGCKFNSAAIGYGGTKFINCIFISCIFSKTIFNRPEFINVQFKNCRINKIDFNASSFENCSFYGVLKDVWFRGGFPLESDILYFGKPKENLMKNVSFENAELEDLTFSDNCDLSSVMVQNSNTYYKFNRWKERLEYLKQKSINWDQDSKKEVDIFVKTFLVHAKNQQWQILNKNNIVRDYGYEVSAKILSHLVAQQG